MKKQEKNKLGIEQGNRIEFKTVHTSGFGIVRQVYHDMVIVMVDRGQDVKRGFKLAPHYLNVYNSQIVEG